MLYQTRTLKSLLLPAFALVLALLSRDTGVGPRRRPAFHEERRVAQLHRRREGHQVLAARIRSTRPTSTSWKSPGASRPTTSGPRPEYKLEGTPLMVNGVIYTTAGTRRSVVALDAKTGELIWVHSMREGARGAIAPRQLSGRGVSYWTDGKGDDRMIYVTHRLSAGRAERQDRRGDQLVRHERHRRSEGRRGYRDRTSRSIWKPARSACIPRRPW